MLGHVLALVLLLLAAPTARPAGQLAGSWEQRARVPTPRSEVGGALVGAEIYVVGGFDAQAATAVESYDPAADAWRARAALPVGLNHAAAVGLNGKLYVVGGFDPSAPSNRLLEYDPALDRW